MADTLEQIYINTSLGATELNDGEHTLLTTDANTSYVIKDMNVINTSGLGSTNLDLNGFNVGSLTSNATGSLIIPPSSTLKIKTTDYPLKAYEKRTVMHTNQNSIVIQKEFFDGAEKSIGTSKIGYTGNSTGLSTSVQNADLVEDGSNTYVAYTTTDGNSAQSVKQVLSKAYATAGGETAVESGNYIPFGLFDHPTYGHVAVSFTGNNSTSLRYHTLGDAPRSSVTPSSWNSGSISNGSYVGTTSSYPKGYCDHGYFWYNRGNSYGGEIYAINMLTGVAIRFSCNSALVAERPFVIAYRPTDDKFILYHHNNNSNFAVKVFAKTRTQIDAITANTNYSAALSFSSENQYAYVNTPSTGSSPAVRQLSYDKAGNMGFQDSNAHLRFHSPTGTYLGATSDVEDITFIDGQTLSSDNKVFTQRYKLMTSQEIATQGITAPTFGIQLLGIKNV